MPRLLPTPILLRAVHPTRLLHSTVPRAFASGDTGKGGQNSSPGWGGRSTDDHAVKRDGLDAQSKESQSGMSKREDAKAGASDSSHGQGVSRRDEKGANKKAEEDHPEAPKPVIGMNSERGAKGQH